MTTAPTLYLEFEKSKRRLDLASDRYRIGSEFKPPTAISDVVLASGTSANTVGRSRAVSRSPRPVEFPFDLQIWGDTHKEVERALADLQTSLSWAGDDLDALYLVYRGNSDTPEPIFGQGGSVRYKVVSGDVEISSDYSIRPSREHMLRDNRVTLLLQPYAHGAKQKLARAAGGVYVQRRNSDSSEITGLVVPESRANYCPNPIFAHPTFGTGWTAAAGLVAFENTDRRFVFAGSRSAYLVSQSSGSRVYYWAVSLSAAAHVISFRVKRRDSGVVDASTCQAYFNNALRTSNYTSLGDGWYLVWYTGTASASSVNYGVGLASGGAASLYVDGFQLEPGTIPTPLIHADAIGCSAVGPIHNSVSSRSTARAFLRAADNHRLLGSGTISAIVTTPNTGYPSNIVVFFESSTGFRLYYSGSTWRFSDNTTEISATDPLTEGKRTHLHIRYGSQGIALYVNGVFQSSSATYTPAAAIGDMYLLTESTPSLHANHWLSEYVVWGEELTATQIANDYETKLSLSGQATSIPPVFWTKDGDNRLDNANDNTRDNYGVAFCVPGSAAALTRIVGGSAFDLENVSIGNWEIPDFINPSRVLYYEGTGTADGTCSGGSFDRTSVSTTEASLVKPLSLWSETLDRELFRFVKGRRFGCIVRARGAGYIRWRHNLSPLSMQQTQRRYIAGYFRNHLLPAVTIPETADEIQRVNDEVEVLGVSASGTVNFDVDFACLFPHPCFTFNSGNAFVIDGREYDSAYGVSGNIASGVVVGGEINLRPNAYNVIMASVFGMSNILADNSIDSFVDLTTIEVTPRWELLP